MKYVLIGCGRIAPNHIHAALENRLDIAAVCDILPENMVGLLREFNLQNQNIKRYTDYKKMIDEVRPQVAAVATESWQHAEMALYCIDRGIHVIIEKPMAMNMKDADEIIRRSAEKGVKVCVSHQNRFNQAIQKTRKALEAGHFGRLSHGAVNVRWYRDKAYYDQAEWRGKWAKDGGTLMNQCIHGIDLLRWMFGDEVDEVYGATRRQFHDYIEGEDLGMAIVKFKNGAVATIEGTVNTYQQNLEETLFISGEKGTVKIGGPCVNTIEVWDFADAIENNKGFVEPTENIYGNGHVSLYADFIDAVQNNRKPYVDAVAGRNALEMVLAIYKSQKEGKPVKLPLTDFGSEDMSGEFDE